MDYHLAVFITVMLARRLVWTIISEVIQCGSYECVCSDKLKITDEAVNCSLSAGKPQKYMIYITLFVAQRERICMWHRERESVCVSVCVWGGGSLKRFLWSVCHIMA